MYVAFMVHFQVIILDFDKQGKVEAATFVVGFSFSNSSFQPGFMFVTCTKSSYINQISSGSGLQIGKVIYRKRKWLTSLNSEFCVTSVFFESLLQEPLVVISSWIMYLDCSNLAESNLWRNILTVSYLIQQVTRKFNVLSMNY